MGFNSGFKGLRVGDIQMNTKVRVNVCSDSSTFRAMGVSVLIKVAEDPRISV